MTLSYEAVVGGINGEKPKDESFFGKEKNATPYALS
jgi:hypothetical protein